MKTYFYLMVMMALFLGCESNKKEQAEIFGHIVDNDKLKEVILFKTVNGNPVEIAKTSVAADGFYGFVFSPDEEGVYMIGNYPMDTYRVYIKSGDVTEIDLCSDKMKLIETNSKEMKLFYDWYLLSYEADLYGVRFMKSRSTYEDFFPAFEKLLKASEAFKANIKTGNKKFDTLMPWIVEYDKDMVALSLLYTPRTKHSTKEERPAYYSTLLNKKKLEGLEILQLPYGSRLMDMYMMYYPDDKGIKCSDKERMEGITDNFQLRGEIVLAKAMSFKFYEDYLRMMTEDEKYFVTEDQKKRAEAIGSKLYNPDETKVAANFAYPDVNGKMVSLSDFKEKVVLVDVWATWCSPCRSEIPHLKKLEEELHGKDIVFMGVSLDVEKDKQKWMEMVKKENLKGVQLFADGFKSKIAADYRITSIPRFLVFDKKGNIVALNAPRPSNPELKKLLLKLSK